MLRKRILLKMMAFFLSFCLAFCESLSYAQQASPQSLRGLPPRAAGRSNDFSIEIPDSLGRIEESHVSNSSQTIIYLQDAHDSLEAQENIAKIIDYLVEHHGVKTVFEEGFEGPLPTDEYFGFIKDSQVKERVSHQLLDELRIRGSEYAHINRTKDFALIGIENLKLYFQNIEAYRSASKKHKETEEDLTALEKEILNLAHRHFPPELKEWIKIKQRLDQKALPLLDYLKRMRELLLSGNRGVNKATTYPYLHLFLEAERSKDQTVIEKIKSIDAKAFFEELYQMERDVATLYLENGRDRKVFEAYQTLQLLKKLNHFTISPEEYEAVQGKLKEFKTVDFANLLISEERRVVILSKRWERNIRMNMQFYDLAHARDEAIGQTLLRHSEEARRADEESQRSFVPLRGTQDDVTVLVFGGFHKEKIKSILRDLGFSYYVISPRIASVSELHQKRYRELMRLGYERFKTSPLRIAVAPLTELFVKRLGLAAQMRFRSELRQRANMASESLLSDSRAEVRAKKEEDIRVALIGDTDRSRLLLIELNRRGIRVPIWAARTPPVERLPFLTRNSNHPVPPAEEIRIIGDRKAGRIYFEIGEGGERGRIKPIVFSESPGPSAEKLAEILVDNQIDTVILDAPSLIDKEKLEERGIRVIVLSPIQPLASYEVGKVFQELANRKAAEIQFGQVQVIEPNATTFPSTYRIPGAGQLTLARKVLYEKEFERGLGLPENSGLVPDTIRLGYPIVQGTILSYVVTLNRRVQAFEVTRLFEELAEKDGFFIIPEAGALLNTERFHRQGDSGVYLLGDPIVETTEDGRSFVQISFILDPIQTEIEAAIQRLQGRDRPRFERPIRSYQETQEALEVSREERELAEAGKRELATGEVREIAQRYGRKWRAEETKRALREGEITLEESVPVLFDRETEDFERLEVLKTPRGVRVALVGWSKSGEIFATTLITPLTAKEVSHVQEDYYASLRNRLAIEHKRTNEALLVRDVYQPAENLSAVWKSEPSQTGFVLTEVIVSQGGRDKVIARPQTFYQPLKEDELGVYVNGAGGRIGSLAVRLLAGDEIAPGAKARPLSGKLIPLAMGVSHTRDEQGNFLSGAEAFARLIQTDPATGPFAGEISHGFAEGREEDWVEFTPKGGQTRRVAVFSHPLFRNPENNPLVSFLLMGISVEAVEATGNFSDLHGINKYLWAGAEGAVMTNPGSSKEDHWNTHTFVYNVNNNEYHASKEPISMASCTTGCASGLNDFLQQVSAEVMADSKLPLLFRKEYRYPMTGTAITYHSDTGERLSGDLTYDPDEKTQGRMVAGRSAYPAPTGFARTGKIVIPEVKATGIAIRGPWVTGSVLSPVLDVPGHWTEEKLRSVAARGDDPHSTFRLVEDLTSSQQIQRMFGGLGSLHAAVDAGHIRIIHTTDNRGRPRSIISIPTWYENEWGYTVSVLRFLDEVVRPERVKTAKESRAEPFPARLSATPEEGQVLYSDRLFLNNFRDEELVEMFRGKIVTVRVDYNVVEPRLVEVVSGKYASRATIIEDFRIGASVPDIQRLVNAGARVVLISHNGRHADVIQNQAGYSLAPVADRLSELLGFTIQFSPETVGPAVREKVESLKEGEVLLLENLRTYAGEEGGDVNFAEEIYQTVRPDAYVFAAFGAAHRGPHASISPLIHILRREKPEAPVWGGELVEKELRGLREFLNDPTTGKNAVAILGGAKPGDKIEIMRELIANQRVRKIIILGAMSLYFYLAKGQEVSNSFLEDDAGEVEKSVQLAFEILGLAKSQGVEIVLPAGYRGIFHSLDIENPIPLKSEDIHSLPMDGQKKDLPDGFYAYSVDSATVDRVALETQDAEWVILNGTAGVVEVREFRTENDAILEMLDERVRAKKTKVLILGGDGGAAFSQWAKGEKAYGPSYLENLPDEYTLSTAGGAALELLARKTLSGLEPLDIQRNHHERAEAPVAVYGNLKWRLRTPEGIRRQLEEIVREIRAVPSAETIEIVIFVPSDLAKDRQLFEIIKDSPIKLGVQNVRLPNEETDEITAEEAKNFGYTHVMLGHSDRRRRIPTETSQVVNTRLKSTLNAGLIPLLLFGEDLDERLREIQNPEQRGLIIDQQLSASLEGISADEVQTIRFGYEPVWAVGKQAASSFYANLQLESVKEILANLYPEDDDFRPIMGYGGSANEQNTASYLSRQEISFVLPGRASTDAVVFAQMVRQAVSFAHRAEVRMAKAERNKGESEGAASFAEHRMEVFRTLREAGGKLLSLTGPLSRGEKAAPQMETVRPVAWEKLAELVSDKKAVPIVQFDLSDRAPSAPLSLLRSLFPDLQNVTEMEGYTPGDYREVYLGDRVAVKTAEGYQLRSLDEQFGYLVQEFHHERITFGGLPFPRPIAILKVVTLTETKLWLLEERGSDVGQEIKRAVLNGNLDRAVQIAKATGTLFRFFHEVGQIPSQFEAFVNQDDQIIVVDNFSHRIGGGERMFEGVASVLTRRIQHDAEVLAYFDGNRDAVEKLIQGIVAAYHEGFHHPEGDPRYQELLIHRDERFVARAEVRKVDKKKFTRLDNHEQAKPLQEKYAVVIDMSVFDALSREQQIEVKKLIHARPEVRFVFNVMGERRLDPTLQELMNFRDRYRNVELRIDPTSFNFQGRQVISIAKEGIQAPYADWIERKFLGDEKFRSVRYSAHDPEAGLMTAALLLSEGGKWNEIVPRGQSFSHVPSFLRSEIRQLIDNYVYVSRSA